MQSFLPGQVFNLLAKGTYPILVPKLVRKKEWSTKCTSTYLDLFIYMIVFCEFCGVDVLEEVLTSLIYVFRRKTATFSMTFFQNDSEGSYQTYLAQQNCFIGTSSVCD